MSIRLNQLNIFPPNRRKHIIDNGFCTSRNWDAFVSWSNGSPVLSWDMVSDGNLLYATRFNGDSIIIGDKINGQKVIYDYSGHHCSIVGPDISYKVGSLKSLILGCINHDLRENELDCSVVQCRSKHKEIECPGMWIHYCSEFIKLYFTKDPKKHKDIPYFEDFEKVMEVIEMHPKIVRPPKI